MLLWFTLSLKCSGESTTWLLFKYYKCSALCLRANLATRQHSYTHLPRSVILDNKKDTSLLPMNAYCRTPASSVLCDLTESHQDLVSLRAYAHVLHLALGVDVSDHAARLERQVSHRLGVDLRCLLGHRREPAQNLPRAGTPRCQDGWNKTVSASTTSVSARQLHHYCCSS